MSTEIPVLYREIRNEFKTRMENSGGDFVEKPKSMERLKKKRTAFVQNARQNNREYLRRLNFDATELSSLYDINSLEAKDLILRAWDIRDRLKESGAIFGSEAFNFALDRIVISQDQNRQIVSASQNVTKSISKLLNLDTKYFGFNKVELDFERLKLTTNAARIDIVLTQTGPQVIEVNSQWVDAVGALAGFISVYDSPTNGKNIIENYAETFPVGTKLAMLNIQQTSGSRSEGASQELALLSQRLIRTKNNKIISCEVIDPNKTRLSYLDRFNSFYINCDPKYFVGDEPDWVEYVARRVESKSALMFPNWRPSLDKKFILTILSKDPENYVAPTLSLADFDVNALMSGNLVVKGDGYSLNSVAISGQPNFRDFVGYALQEPQSYVVQPFLDSIKRDSWVYDTGVGKVKLIRNAYTKINVWVVKGEVLGMLATVSDSPLISDKGYNVPLLVKGEK